MGKKNTACQYLNIITIRAGSQGQGRGNGVGGLRGLVGGVGDRSARWSQLFGWVGGRLAVWSPWFGWMGGLDFGEVSGRWAEN